ncbi:low affinity iron permease family protein [Candidatus Parcubacteria bacterium]|nr:low affinity iron permease family protein [Candidatus Parcubacteria bacterium]
MNNVFHFIAHKTSNIMGSSWAFIVALAIVVGWAITGPWFGYSDTWQLFINTGTTVLTFLMVFLIQNTQNRDAHAVHLKLDELIKAIGPARNRLIDIEDMEDEELEKFELEFKKLRERLDARKRPSQHQHPHL